MGFLIWAVILILIIFRAYHTSRQQKATFRKTSSKPYASPSPVERKTVHHGNTSKAHRAKEDVLTRAKRNVAEDFSTADSCSSSRKTDAPPQDTLHTESGKSAASISDSAPQTISSGSSIPSLTSVNLMEDVENLIVKGYEPHLTFERDFLSESMDLLNDYYRKNY